MGAEQNDRQSVVLAVDVGNTQTQFGLLCVGDLVQTWTISTRRQVTVDEARLAIGGFFATLERCGDSSALVGPDGRIAPDDAIMSCVVPDVTDAWTKALQIECGRKPFIVGPGLKTGIKMSYNDPSEIGADRVANIAAAKQTYGFPLIVVDVGTATTFDVLDAEGVFLGGIIAPGLELSARAITQAAAKLPIIEVKAPTSIIGKTTREAMQSGVVLGEVARIDGLIEMIWKELGREIDAVITGSDAEAIAALSKHIARFDETLLLRGLGILYTLNAKF